MGSPGSEAITLTGADGASRVGHFRIVRKTGEGRMGVVYEAWDERLRRPVAIKTLRAADENEAARKRLWTEARALAYASHPHVCQLFDVGEAGGTLFLVLELLEGQSLASRLSGHFHLRVKSMISEEIR